MMDRSLQERIVGAVVLVAFAVLLVPIFLDGKPEGIEEVQQRITLPGQEEVPQKTIVLERDRDQPVPAPRQSAPPPPAVAEERPAPQTMARSDVATPAAEEPPAEQGDVAAGSAPATSATGMWAVQLGSFSNQENAERLAASLRKDGFAAFLSRLDSGSQALHRVRIGPQKDRASAEQVAARLKAAGHDGQVVPHP